MMVINIEKYISVLKFNRLFLGMSSEELFKLFRENGYNISRHSRNGVIHLEGEICKTLDIILAGEVLVQKIDEDGNVLTISRFVPGDNIAGNLLFSSHPYYPMSVSAKTDVILLRIDKGLVLKLCQSSMDFLLEFLACMSDKTATLTSTIKSISMKTIREAVIDLLSYEYSLQKSHRIKFNMTKKIG